MKKQMIGNVPGNVLGMIADLSHKLQTGGILPEELGLFLKRQDPFSGENSRAIALAWWENFYQEQFGISLDLSGVYIPQKPAGGKWRLLIIAEGFTAQRFYEKCGEHFKIWKWTHKSLDDVIDPDQEQRSAKNGAYAIWVRDVVEADGDLKNLSANQIKEKGIKTEILAERLLHELVYFLETGKHLNVKNVTLCLGSRYLDGNVPSVYLDSGGDVSVYRDDPDYRFERLRSRQAVS